MSILWAQKINHLIILKRGKTIEGGGKKKRGKFVCGALNTKIKVGEWKKTKAAELNELFHTSRRTFVN